MNRYSSEFCVLCFCVLLASLLDRRVLGVLHVASLVCFPKFVRNSQARRTALGKATLSVIEEMTELELPSRVEAIAEAATAAAEITSRLGLSEEGAFGVDISVREAVTNAVLHGNQQDETKSVQVTFTSSPEGLVIMVRDRGEGFDPETVPDPTDPQNVLKASGRGIFFMRTFMDTVEWSRHPEGGTVVRMTKRR